MSSGIGSEISSMFNMLGYGYMDDMNAADQRVEHQKREARYNYKTYMELMYPGYVDGWHVAKIREALEAVERRDINRLILSVPPRHALALDTPIATPSGWTTMGELKVGDQVFDENGNPCNVTWVSPVYVGAPTHVVTASGEDIVADDDHLWAASLCRKRRDVDTIRSTRYLAARSSDRKAVVRMAGALSLPEADLPIPPYTLGVWLAEGDSRGGGITLNPDDAGFIRARIADDGYETSVRSSPGSHTILGLRGQLGREGLLQNKHIPPAYLRASVDQRLALLHGLMDGDGTCPPSGQLCITQVNKVLSDGILELVRSLGVKASQYEIRASIGDKDCGPAWIVSFYMEGAASLPRKAANCREASRMRDHYIDVHSPGTASTVCIEVDSPSSLYLAGRAMVPTHNSKSMHVSEGFPAWYLGRNPGHRIIAASHTQRLAETFSRRVRNQVTSSFWPFPWVGIAPDNGGVGQWDVEAQGGGYLAVGVGGSPTGQGGNLIIIDDPIKSVEDAESPVMREKLWEWYQGTLYTRRQPGAAIVITQTRWHEADLVGSVLEHEGSGGDKWEVLNFPAENPDGSFLWEDFWPAEEYMLAKRSSTRVWNAQYMGSPSTEGGNLLKEQWFKTITEASRYDRIVVAYDTADKVGLTNDFTACVVIGVRPGGYDILHVHQIRVEFPDLIRDIDNHMSWAMSSFGGAPVSLVIEDAQSGTSAIQYLRSSRPNYAIYAAKSFRTNEKVMRVLDVTPLVETGRVFVPENALWKRDFFSQITQFPYDKHDDMVDAFSIGISHAAGIGESLGSGMSIRRYGEEDSASGFSYERRRRHLRGEQ